MLGAFLREVVAANPRPFRLVGPDETASNRLQAVFEVTDRAFEAELLPARRPPGARRAGDGDPLGAPVRGVAGGLPAHRPARPVHLLRGLHPHRRLDGQPARQVAQGDPGHPVAPARSPRSTTCCPRTCGGRTTTGSPTRTRASSTTWSTRRPRSSACTCRRTPTRCCRWPTTACAAGTPSTSSWPASSLPCTGSSLDAAVPALRAGHRDLGLGQWRPGRRARRGDGLLRRRADHGDAGRGDPAARAPAAAEGPGGQRGGPDAPAGRGRAPARVVRLRVRRAVHHRPPRSCSPSTGTRG